MTMRNRMKTEYIAIAFGLLGCTGHAFKHTSIRRHTNTSLKQNP